MATGGVGEAMLIGAMTGAGSSAVTGGDPLKGALYGAMGGGFTHGLGGALGGSAGAAGAGMPALDAAAYFGGPGGSFANIAPAGVDAAAYFGGPGGSFANIAPAGLDADAAAAYFGGPGGSFANMAPAPNAGITGAFDGKSFFDNLKGTPSTGDLLDRDKQKTTSALADLIKKYPLGAPAAGGAYANLLLNRPDLKEPEQDSYDGPLSKYRFNPFTFNPNVTPYPRRYANGGIAGTEMGMYPQSQFDKTQYAVPSQMPTSAEVIAAGYEPKVNPYTGEPRYATGGKLGLEKIEDLIAEAKSSSGGIASLLSKAESDDANALAAVEKMRQQKQTAESHKKGLAATRAAEGGLMDSDLGSYSDGGRLLKGPGDGMSDDIPARIGRRQPARLADGEFVIPADVVSGLGNGSTDAGAKQLYAMMDRVRKSRTGTKKQGKEIKPMKYVPA